MKKGKYKDVCELLIWNFPTELKKKLKIICIEEEKTLLEIITEIIENFLDKK